MRTMRNLFAASVLAFGLSLSTIAGDMHTGAPQPVPTPTPDGQVSTALYGDIHTGNSDEQSASDVVAEAALSLLQGVLSLL